MERPNRTTTVNRAVSLESTLSACLDFFSSVGAMRQAPEAQLWDCFKQALQENRLFAMKLLFFTRDIREGLGERRIFRVLLAELAAFAPELVEKNITLIPIYGRWDDVLTLLQTPCEQTAVSLLQEQLQTDLTAGEREPISLLAKWLPSVNASSRETVQQAKLLCKRLGMQEAQYRKCLSQLRRKLQLLENNLRERDYTFDYEKQPSKAMFRYRKAFLRNDGPRYTCFLHQVMQGKAKLHTGTLMPYEIIAPCFEGWRARAEYLTKEQELAIDTTWNAQEDFGNRENALAVIDGSGSMYSAGEPVPAAVALSLGIYFAERNQGAFHHRFITFSQTPQLVELPAAGIVEKLRFCSQFKEVANTDLQKVFDLILEKAIAEQLPQSELPQKLYILSDLEFDRVVDHGEQTNFEAAQQKFEMAGYTLPEVVFWKIHGRPDNQPVTKNQQGVALLSGCTPKLFAMAAGHRISPYETMAELLNQDRYQAVRV